MVRVALVNDADAGAGGAPGTPVAPPDAAE
jgi:hypothetical protein